MKSLKQTRCKDSSHLFCVCFGTCSCEFIWCWRIFTLELCHAWIECIEWSKWNSRCLLLPAIQVGVQRTHLLLTYKQFLLGFFFVQAIHMEENISIRRQTERSTFYDPFNLLAFTLNSIRWLLDFNVNVWIDFSSLSLPLPHKLQIHSSSIVAGNKCNIILKIKYQDQTHRT